MNILLIALFVSGRIGGTNGTVFKTGTDRVPVLCRQVNVQEKRRSIDS